MKHSLSTLRLASVALAAMSLLAGAARADVTVISFGGSIQKAQVKAFYEPFAKAGGKVVPGEYNGELARVKAMVDAGNVIWDVVEVESPELARGCEEGLYEKLDMSRIGAKGDFIPGTVTECGFAFCVWSTVLAYNSDAVKTPPRSWADFWDIKKFPGKRGMRKAAKSTLEFALVADGVKPEEVYKTLATPAGVARAFRKLDEIKPYIQWWEAGSQPPALLATGDVVMSVAFNGRIGTAQKEGKTNLKIVWTNNLYDFESWAIPVGTPKRDEAYKFIALAGEPQNQAVFSGEIPYGPTHLKAVPLVDPAILPELPTAPQNMEGAFASDPQFWAEYGEDLEQRFNAWAAK
jgi:putative spermidine/putrescine transport system substrate-binding protein